MDPDNGQLRSFRQLFGCLLADAQHFRKVVQEVFIKATVRSQVGASPQIFRQARQAFKDGQVGGWQGPGVEAGRGTVQFRQASSRVGIFFVAQVV